MKRHSNNLKFKILNLRLNTALRIALSCLLIVIFSASPHSPSAGERTISKGVWISVFSDSKIFDSKKNIDKVLKVCQKSGVGDIYLQVYRAGKAYYDSEIDANSNYKAITKRFKGDPVDYMLSEAREKGIRVHAWINLLSVAQNKDAPIIKKYGQDVLAKDKLGRASYGIECDEALKNRFILEDQIFLEPGDKNVRKYLVSIASEITSRYPAFYGVHLDYVRYPATVPFTPGSKFDSHGLSYGYGDNNINAFKKANGFNPKTVKFTRENCTIWDRWRRDQVTRLVKDISVAVRGIKPDGIISCTVMPALERTYLVTFQDWTRWLGEGYADYIVSMNYTDDSNLMELRTKSMLFPEYENKVHIGLGAYILKDKALVEQLEILEEIAPAGIVLFSYDDLAKSRKVQKELSGI